ncbi:preprotein translocase subunit SecE [Williamsia sp.]|uniref:preprotein translocase subunit SecE n=1 Tax=Williamsia sp. TaxID=1872085 RepID=UPI002F93B6AF
MSKRDRAERAKNAGESTDEVELDASVDSATDSVDDAASGDTATQARPTGKRSPRGKRTSLAKSDDDADSTTSAVSTKEAGKAEKRKRVKSDDSRNPFTRLYVFLTQVVGELKKVIWPTRKQLIQYTIIVLIFVILMVTFISVLDLAFAKGVLWLFG